MGNNFLSLFQKPQFPSIQWSLSYWSASCVGLAANASRLKSLQAALAKTAHSARRQRLRCCSRPSLRQARINRTLTSYGAVL